ncbi:MAG: arabinogalactan endo-1,4-beta-galactosidase [Prevotella sp.]|jgi:arabinogalactan endo-1,4-beta-galactosidase|nr:arabinogalactan endo-1,4-beta-galactosidase [Prevotella sp.]
MKLKNIILSVFIALFSFSACSDDDNPEFPESPVYDMSGFAKGADIGWLTEMEKSSKKFYNSIGTEKDCIELLRDLGMNSVRLRVWVDPQNGWCNAEDVLIKAWRAKNLGMRIMVNFHYSDSWADPSQQTKPAAWADLDLDELKQAVADHTTEVLTKLKTNGIDVEWVQIGNETSDGMLWRKNEDDPSPSGKASESMKNYAELNNAGYDAAKAVYPNAKMIVHLNNGFDNDLFRWLFDGLKNNGGKWDVIGMSLYPSTDDGDWEEKNEACLENMEDMISRYGTEVMICEVGMAWDAAETAKDFLTDLIEKAKSVEGGKCLGVLYWEPESYGNWDGYTMGAFDNSGKPTVAMDAFK